LLTICKLFRSLKLRDTLTGFSFSTSSHSPLPDLPPQVTCHFLWRLFLKSIPRFFFLRFVVCGGCPRSAVSLGSRRLTVVIEHSKKIQGLSPRSYLPFWHRLMIVDKEVSILFLFSLWPPRCHSLFACVPLTFVLVRNTSPSLPAASATRSSVPPRAPHRGFRPLP